MQWQGLRKQNFSHRLFRQITTAIHLFTQALPPLFPFTPNYNPQPSPFLQPGQPSACPAPGLRPWSTHRNAFKRSASSRTCVRAQSTGGSHLLDTVIPRAEAVATEGLCGHWWTCRGGDIQEPAAPAGRRSSAAHTASPVPQPGPGFRSTALSHTPPWIKQVGCGDWGKSDSHRQEETLRHKEHTVQILHYLLNKEIKKKKIKTESICIKSKSSSSA